MKMRKIKMTSSAAPPSTETETPVDQLYAQVDKKKKNKKAKEATSSPETVVDQLYMLKWTRRSRRVRRRRCVLRSQRQCTL